MADENDRWPRLAARAASSKKAIDPVILAVGDVLAITDYFVITSGANARQVRTIAEEVERQLTEAGGPPGEGVRGWPCRRRGRPGRRR